MNSVLLTIDLTKAVADEAIERNDSVIVAYRVYLLEHCIWKWKVHLTGTMKRRSHHLPRTQELDLERYAAGESTTIGGRRDQCEHSSRPRPWRHIRLTILQVYSPHTAVDCARGGLGDWLADIVTGTPTNVEDLPEEESQAQSESASIKSKRSQSPTKQQLSVTETNARPVYMLQHHPSQMDLNDKALELGKDKHQRYPIQATSVEGYPGAGMGRVVRLPSAVPLTEIIDRIGLGLGNPRGFPIAVPQGKEASDMMISSIAICAGSGGHLFGELDKASEDVDLLFTGELSHHEALHQIERGRCVICLFHSNTERGFLSTVLKPQLEKAIQEEVCGRFSFSRLMFCNGVLSMLTCVVIVSGRKSAAKNVRRTA